MSRYFTVSQVQANAARQASGKVTRACGGCGHAGSAHMLGRHECHTYAGDGTRCACAAWTRPE